MKIGIFNNNEPFYKNKAKKIIKILKNHELDFKICSGFKADCDIVMVVGGDGTVFRAIRRYPNTAILPIKRLSHNLDEFAIERALEKIEKGKYAIEKVMRLQFEYKDFKAWGINDIVISRDDENANRFRIFSNGKDLYGDEIMGDGVIAATPYGSTGYNWTAGGPILRGKGKFVITPVCSAFFNRRFFTIDRNVSKRVEESKIFSDSKKIIIKFFRNVRNKIIADGIQENRFYINIKSGDKILIRKAKENSKLVKIL